MTLYGISSVRAAEIKRCDRETVVRALQRGELNGTKIGSRDASRWKISTDRKFHNWIPPRVGQRRTGNDRCS